MLTEAASIKTSYEELGMTPDEIAEDARLDVTAVKVCLMQVSPKYRKDCGKEPQNESRLNFTEEQLERINQRIVDLALGSDNEKIALAAATYIRDDFKGRKDVVKRIADQPTMNVLMFNQHIEKIRTLADSAKKLVTQPKTIDAQTT